MLEKKLSALFMHWFEAHFCFGMLEGGGESKEKNWVMGQQHKILSQYER